jgi:hypothetical protein
MEIYIATLVILFLFSFIEVRCELTEVQKKAFLVFTYLILVVQAGFRWKTGTDWPVYTYNYDNTNSVSDVIINIVRGIEPGYGFFVLFIKKIFDNYTFFLVIHALVYYYLIFSAFKKITPFFYVSLLIFYATTLGYLGSNRQLIAIAICFNAFHFVKERKALQFFLMVGLAVLFHTTALMFLFFYFFDKKIKLFYLFIILILCFIIGKTNVPFAIFSFIGNLIGGGATYKVEFYTENAKTMLAENSLGLFGLIRRLLYLVLFIINFKYLNSKYKYYNLFFNGYFFGLIFYFLFSSTLIVLVNRGSLYFNMVESFLLASQILIFKDRVERGYVLIILLIICLVLLLQSISSYSDLFLPYKGLFFNRDFDREVY